MHIFIFVVLVPPRLVVSAASALRGSGGPLCGLDLHDVVHGNPVLCALKVRSAEPIQRYCSSGLSWRRS
eukprot:9150678-Heterocapsa_arctica.AAC.1